MKTFGTSIACVCGYYFVEINTVKKEDKKWIMDIQCSSCKREAVIEIKLIVISLKEARC